MCPLPLQRCCRDTPGSEEELVTAKVEPHNMGGPLFRVAVKKTAICLSLAQTVLALVSRVGC